MLEILGDLFELTNSVVYLAEPSFEDWAAELEVFMQVRCYQLWCLEHCHTHYEMLFVIGILFVVIATHLSVLEIVLESGSDQPNS